MAEELDFKRFEKMSEEEVDAAITFVFSKEEQENFSSDEVLEEDLDPEKYVFITRPARAGRSPIVGFFSIAKTDNFTIETAESGLVEPTNSYEVTDFRIDVGMSPDDIALIVERIFSLDFPLKNIEFEDDEAVVWIHPSPSKSYYYAGLELGFGENLSLCYKKIKKS